MSLLKINDLQAAQTEGYISELTETELTVCGGLLNNLDNLTSQIQVGLVNLASDDSFNGNFNGNYLFNDNDGNLSGNTIVL